MSIEDYVEHMPPLVPPEDVHEMSRYMLAKCPVVHSDQDGGFWLVNRHEDLVRVMQDWRGFASGNRGVRVPNMPIDQPPKPPIDWPAVKVFDALMTKLSRKPSSGKLGSCWKTALSHVLGEATSTRFVAFGKSIEKPAKRAGVPSFAMVKFTSHELAPSGVYALLITVA